MKSITCTFAVPPTILSPNARPGHWRQTYGPKRRAFIDARLATHRAEGTRFGVGATCIYMDAKWYGKTRHVFEMDKDNAWATLKSTLDGAADQMECDDKVFAPRSMEFDHDSKNPRVEITFTVEDEQ